MSEQKASEASQLQTPLPKQPEVNIGTSGHVDHGKCVGYFDYALVNGQPMTGQEIDNLMSQQGKLIARIDEGEYYSFEDNSVISMDEKFQPVIGKARFYKEHYRGVMVNIETSTGRKISVTPSHPLLVNRGGTILWIPSEALAQGDHVSILRTVPLPEDAAFYEPVNEMRQMFDLVTWEEYEQLRVASNEFSNLHGLDERQIDQIRIVAGLPVSKLCRRAKVSENSYRKLLRGKPIRIDSRVRLLTALERSGMQRLTPGQFLIGMKRGRYPTRKLTSLTMDVDLAKWFAFVWSGGTSRANSVGVTQTVQMEMLLEWREITRRKLGVEIRAYKDGSYRINNFPFVWYLRKKFGFVPGNESVRHIQPWVCKLPKAQKKAFLRWFLTLDGEFDKHSGQIIVTQANEKNIVILAYLLHSFGIVPRLGVRTRKLKRGMKEYFKLSISGRSDLGTFAREIGFEDLRIQEKLTRYLERIKKESKETDFSIPIDFDTFKEHLRISGLVREGFGGTAPPFMGSSEWYKAYEMAGTSGRLSRTRLLLVIREIDSQVQRLQGSLSRLRSSPSGILAHMSLAGFPQGTIANELGFSRRKLMRILKKGTATELESLAVHVEEKTRKNIKSIESWLVQLRRLATTPMEFDRIDRIDRETYDGMVFDLSVPGPMNFIGGTTSIVCHNTTLTQALTGVWASAHSEELRRGITIKVGYADAAVYKCTQDHGAASYSTSPVCPVCGRKTVFLRAISFVDCPGHESLMTNMLAGAFLMDGALLVVAANEPVPKPQTREHLQALQMLGMKKIVIAQNKVDLVTDAEAEKNYSQIQKFTKGTVAESAPIIPISAQQKLNIDALIESLESVVPTPKRDAGASPLMYILRSFDVNKPGAAVQGLSGGVLGGSLTRGELRVGEEIELRPGMVDERSGKFVPVITKVSSLQTSAGPSDRVGPGGLIAVGTHLDPTFVKGDQMVGSVIGKPGTLPETLEHVTLDVTLLETAVGATEQVKVEKLKLSETVRLNLGTASTLAVATSVRGEVAELDLKKPVAIESGMRAAISRRIAERWRLIGSGVLK
ncbi:MAG: translation initiation factor IF-2 subunit gamma [Nitrososphaerota archaeon]|nr:translation initiation factor IF-2 subunit gamma [Nitrososphaerota archaeon]MDG6942101.1 translation initiation factor IF-2 subunit gamma [Nitrososphaerota archaeon]MDG6942566.1 translation initiation factor IF-2 subunit gamma [Nitrososphaerota archaeon]MDG6948353.1 translation initiation factor IF-2 subunit gamma [Nitrososphaerota archaeon]MDG6950279.1 translation initiation factor IF-2 subunit gamma [Nitrososphaerota archaeon]